MRRSRDRILTTHTGSLPRPPALRDCLVAQETGQDVDAKELSALVEQAVADVVAQQLATGLDVVNDGEMSKFFYATYIKDRLTGFEGESLPREIADTRDFKGFANRQNPESRSIRRTPACNGAIAYRGHDDLRRDLVNLRAAADGSGAEDVFMTAASPGVVACFLQNQHYDSDEAYVYAVADAMKTEYDAIREAGFIVQLDCPDLAMGRHFQFADDDEATFRRNAEMHVEAMNHALRDIEPEYLRMHLCWGNYEGPHHCDIDLHKIIDIVLRARPSGLSLEGANPRHGHEWAVFKDVKLPDGKILIPGVIDSTTNYIDHPELIAQRIENYARLVGVENVIAGVDCGFSTSAVSSQVDPEIAWAKLKSLVQGAELAWKRLKP